MGEVAGLGADERGVVFGLWRAGATDGTALAGVGAERCRSALAALVALSDEARAAEGEVLAAELGAEVPAGLDRVHPGWMRRLLEDEPSAVVAAVAVGLPAEVGRVADEIVSARGDEAPALPVGPAVAGLRRALFSQLAPMPTPTPTSTLGSGGPERARALCALSFARLVEELEQRGAATLGLALVGAPDAVVARAAAGVGAPLAGVVLASARSDSTAASRAEARALVAGVAGARASARQDSRVVAREVGLRVVAREVAVEGAAALAAVAQRLPPALGDLLLERGAAP
jgi:hypothetical protein